MCSTDLGKNVLMHEEDGAETGEGKDPAETGHEPEPERDPQPEPKPGVTAPLDAVTEEEARQSSAGLVPGTGPEAADDLAERKRELEREDKPWGWEDEEEEK